MLKPADGLEGVKKAVIEAVKDAGPNACPPVVVGVGIGGDFEKSALLAKRALTNELNTVHSYFDDLGEGDLSENIPDSSYLKELQKSLYKEINNLDIGPGGMGGKFTCLGVNLEVYPTHIAGLPLAVNMCCHVNRHVKVTL